MNGKFLTYAAVAAFVYFVFLRPKLAPAPTPALKGMDDLGRRGRRGGHRGGMTVIGPWAWGPPYYAPDYLLPPGFTDILPSTDTETLVKNCESAGGVFYQGECRFGAKAPIQVSEPTIVDSWEQRTEQA